MPEFEDQLDPEHYKQVYDTLKANGFTSRIKLRLVREDLLNVMFNEVLPLGVKAFVFWEKSPHLLRNLEQEQIYELQGKSESSNAPRMVEWLSFRFHKFRTSRRWRAASPSSCTKIFISIDY